MALPESASNPARVPDAFPAGEHWPFGATYIESEKSFNFAIFSRHATSVTLVVYRKDDVINPALTFKLRHPAHKTANIWHCRIPVSALNGAAYYAYLMDGPHDPKNGHRYDPEKILLDPYAPEVYFPPDFSRVACSRPGPTNGVAPLGCLLMPRQARATGDISTVRHTHDLIIYELHVKGFTANPNSGVTEARRGTFAGLVEKIPYLQELGVTVVELLPIHQFDPQEGNYWGYMTLNFFSPHRQYATGDAFDEFRAMVQAFHAAGIEVWLDVVYNHTSEGDQNGPTYSFRGIDNKSYYLLSRDGRYYVNDTGCGNTVRTGHPAGRALVLESLRFWVRKMGVDGFRFDLASIFSRSSNGVVSSGEAPLIMEISYLARLLNVRLVAEAWDIGTYQLGRAFPGLDWMQWNGKFRDDIRAFLRSDPGYAAAAMMRMYGSDDLFPDMVYETYRPRQSINFITAHDGFCLYDLVSYNEKHNESNGHKNTDGSDNNISWNCGHEGDVDAPPRVLELRLRQAKNFCALLLLAQGTPMIVAGDEFLNTQRGNNNPYNQDNVATWIDWERLNQNKAFFNFFKKMIALRKAHPSIARPTYWREDIAWYGASGPIDYTLTSHAFAYCLHGSSIGDSDFYVMINMHWQDCMFDLQEGSPQDWVRVVDTALESPLDFPDTPQQQPSLSYLVSARSVVVFESPRKRA